METYNIPFTFFLHDVILTNYVPPVSDYLKKPKTFSWGRGLCLFFIVTKCYRKKYLERCKNWIICMTL